MRVRSKRPVTSNINAFKPEGGRLVFFSRVFYDIGGAIRFCVASVGATQVNRKKVSLLTDSDRSETQLSV